MLLKESISLMAYPKLFWKILFVFSLVDFIKLPPIVRTFEKKLYLQMKELFDSIATQNTEIRSIANSLPHFSNNSLKVYFNRLSQTDKKNK